MFREAPASGGQQRGHHKGCPYGGIGQVSEPLIRLHNLQGTVFEMTNTSLISEGQWSQIRSKAGLPQFAAAVGLLREEVEDFFARPVGVQALPGGYYHDYFCPQHAVQLVFEPDSPTLHRCPVDGATFSGEPFDSAWRWSVNNRLAESALRLAVLWKLEGEERNRQRVQEILLGYADAYAGYKAYAGWRPENHGVAQFSTLDEAVWSDSAGVVF